MRNVSLYKKVIVIGYGKITGKIIELVSKRKEDYGYSVEYVEHEIEPFGVSRGICNDLGIPFYRIEDRKVLTEFFENIKEKCLIISASNNYLFPSVLTDDPHYTIINFHNALLPKFPGRNAPSWAIFENEKVTGITWHYVTNKVDGGDIIIQKSCDIDSDIRAYRLADELMCLAYEGFVEKFEEIIEDRVVAKKQKITSKRKLYKSTDYPGNCQFKMEDSGEHIYRLLRAVDFGKYGIFPPVTTIYQQKRIKILRYHKISSEKIEEKPGILYVPLSEKKILKLAWIEITESYEGGVIPDIEYLYELIDEIKKINKKYLSNYYLEQSAFSKAIEENGVEYTYKKKEYLNIWIQKEDFKKLYYFIANPYQYKINNDAIINVCDVVCKISDERNLSKIFLNAGMYQYATYMKWVCDSPVLQEQRLHNYLQIIEKDNGNLFKSALYTYFDKYSDSLPDLNEWDEFIKNKCFIGIYDIDKKAAVAGMVYSKRGSVITEDFVFVVSNYRGQGLSKILHNNLYEKYSVEKIKYIAWIRVDNYESINLHSGYCYKKQNLFKITFIKSNNI